MSTPTTAPQPAAAEEKPFDPYDYPPELREAQLRAATLNEELRAHQATLPWSREPHEGWPKVEERGREREGREPSPGWTPDEAATYDLLWKELRAATLVVTTHPWWERCRTEGGVKGGALVDVRQALKHAEGAAPLTKAA